MLHQTPRFGHDNFAIQTVTLDGDCPRGLSQARLQVFMWAKHFVVNALTIDPKLQ